MAAGARWGRRDARLSLAATAAAVSGLIAGTAGAAASPNAAIHGALTSFAIPHQMAPVQLFAGTDGSVWFVTAGSQLGEVRGEGMATLTGVTLPSGSDFGIPTPATIAAASPEGVWAYAATVGSPSTVDSCSLMLVVPGAQILVPRLPASLSDFACTSAAADIYGSLWVGLVSGKYLSSCHCRVAIVAQVSTSGQVTLYPAVRAGARPQAVVLGADGAIRALEGYNIESIGRYTAGAPPTGMSLPFGGWKDLLARPDGSYWVLRALFCSGLNQPFCPAVSLLSASGSVSTRYIYPVSIPAGGPLNVRTAVGPDGGLWMAGRQSTGPNRLFRMDAKGQIDRSAALVAPGGAPVQAAGPITVTPAGTVWAAAGAGNSSYLVRYVPV